MGVTIASFKGVSNLFEELMVMTNRGHKCHYFADNVFLVDNNLGLLIL